MLGRTDLNFSKLLELYAVANTASYLYRHFRSDTSVIQLAKTYTSVDLAAYIRDKANKDATTEEIICTYATITALSHQPSSEAIPAMEGINLDKLRWGNTLWSICRNSFIASVTSRQEFILPSALIETPTPITNISTTVNHSSGLVLAPQVLTTAKGNTTSKLIRIGETND